MGRLEHLDFLHRLDKCSAELEDDVDYLFGTFNPSNKNATRDGLLRAFPALVERDSMMAAMLAKEYYLTERLVASSEYYPAIIAPLADQSDIEKAVRYACGHIYEGGKLRMSAAAACNQLVASADRFMRERAFGTLVLNAQHDPLRPRCRRYVGGDACDFCKPRATDSFIDPSSVSASLHEHCKCSIDIDFDGSKQHEDELFALKVLQSTSAIGEYEKWYVTREINGLWYKFKDEPRGIIWVGDYKYMFDIKRFDDYHFKWKRLIA